MKGVVEFQVSSCKIGLDWTGHMSFLTGQDRTPKFAGQVLPDWTESGLIFLNILPSKQTKKNYEKNDGPDFENLPDRSCRTTLNPDLYF